MQQNEINIPAGNRIGLRGNLNFPKQAHSLVIFSHGSGRSRFSPRNNYVAEILNENKIATLLTDLLTSQEDSIYENRFDIELLTERLIHVTDYVGNLEGMRNLPIGYFGASTGAASALQAAAHFGSRVSAVVSRGGRPDLANGLERVKACTLLLVGALDEEVIALNRKAYQFLYCEKELKIISGAGHLFEEAGKLDEVASLASGWFEKYLVTPYPYAVQE